MMSKNNSNKKKFSLSSAMADNRLVFAFSLIVAIICWCLVSMSQTTEIERVFQNVSVSIPMDESVAKNSGLEVFGEQDYTVDVTVKGLSYIVNDSKFTNENISVVASCSSVTAAGTYDLPLNATVVGFSGDVEVVNISLKTIKVSFDERVSKSFALTEEIKELDGYSLGTGLIRENPILSVEKLDISGPSKEIAKISSVKALVELNKQLTATERFEAEIIAESSSGVVDLSDCKIELSEPVYVTIPINKVGKYVTAVDFIGMPQSYREEGIKYSVYPSEIDVSVMTGANDTQLNESNEILIGTIDFSQINNVKNRIVINNENLSSEVKNFTVTIDMSSMAKRWLEIPVDASSVTVPDGVKVLSATVESVQIVGPSSSVMNIDKTAAYAVPVFDAAQYSSGKHLIPAKIVLRTLTDSWVHGTYTIEIEVE